MFTVAMEDSVDLVIAQGVLEVLVLCVIVKIVVEARVIDSVHVYVSVGVEEEFLEEGIVLLGVCSMGRVEVF